MRLPSSVSSPDGSDVDCDIVWLNRADTVALHGLVSLLASEDEGVEALNVLLVEAISEQDRPRLTAALWGLASWVDRSPALVQRHTADVLLSDPEITCSQAAGRLTRFLAAKGWTVAPTVCDELVLVDHAEAAFDAGRWWSAARLQREEPFADELTLLPAHARRGVAAELAEAVRHQRPPEAVKALGSLLSDDDPQVRNAASRWAHPHMPVHQGEGPFGIPVELRPLVRSTVLGADKHGLEIELLVSIARHGPEAALSALEILGELLELRPPDGMLDMVAHYALDVAYAAHESLPRDDRAPALDRIDAIIRRDPIATLVKLDSIREKSAD